MCLRLAFTATGLLLWQGAALGQQPDTQRAPELVLPAEHATITQNVESTFCSKSSAGVFGYSIEFAWSKVASATRYELYVRHSGLPAPALDYVTQQLSYELQQCGAFIADANLKQWEWRVRALPESGDAGPWSETRQFEFAPCRLPDGTPCRAPAIAISNSGNNGSPGQPDSRGIYPIGGDVSPPNLIRKAEPEYTEEARKACASGTVLVSLVVDPQGMPQNIRILRPLGLGLDEKAIEAVSKWRFNPGLKSGQPVAVQAQVVVNFRIQCKKN